MLLDDVLYNMENNVINHMGYFPASVTQYNKNDGYNI